MKPIIIKVDSEGKIKITEEELKKIIDDAYNQGFQDGQKQPYVIPNTIPSNPLVTPYYCNTDSTCTT